MENGEEKPGYDCWEMSFDEIARYPAAYSDTELFWTDDLTGETLTLEEIGRRSIHKSQ